MFLACALVSVSALVAVDADCGAALEFRGLQGVEITLTAEGEAPRVSFHPCELHVLDDPINMVSYEVYLCAAINTRWPIVREADYPAGTEVLIQAEPVPDGACVAEEAPLPCILWPDYRRIP